MLTEEDLQKFESMNEEDGWLGGSSAQMLFDYIRTLKQQNKRLIEALAYYAEFGVNPSHGDWDVGEFARDQLKEILGDES